LANFSTTAAANTAVTQTLAASANVVHGVQTITVSFSGTAPTIGLLTVTDNGTTVFSSDLPLSLNTPTVFNVPITATAANQAMVITVAAAGTGAIAKLNTVVKNVSVLL
jgi:hypothetical protein